jgi:hypothetical protein
MLLGTLGSDSSEPNPPETFSRKSVFSSVRSLSMGMIWSITGRYLAGIDLYGLIFFKRLLAAFALTYGQERFMKQRKVPYTVLLTAIVLSTMRSVHFFITIFFIVCLIFSSTCPNPPPHAPPKMPPQRCPPKDVPPRPKFPF